MRKAKLMNIWIVNHYATPPDTPGSTRHYDFARELIKRGHKVSIFAAGFSHRTRKEERLEGRQNYHRQNIDGVEFVWLRTSPYYGGNDWRRVVNMLSYTFRVVPLALKLKEKPEVVLASSPHLFAGLAGWLLAKLKGASFVFEVRDLWPQTLVDIGGYSSKSLVVKTLRVLERFLYNRARKIIALLPRASDYITGLGIPAGKVVYIPNGVSPELFFETSVGLPPELNRAVLSLRSKGKMLVVYTGALGIANALDTILEAARLLQDKGADKVHFLLVGEGPEKQRLTETAQRWRLNNLSLFNPVPKKTVPGLLRASDITIVSVRKSDLYEYGTSINKLYDYMMCAKPIVLAAKLANNSVAESNCGITVPPEEPEVMVEAVMQVCNMNEEERREMGLRGYEYVMKHNSLPVLAERLLEALQEVKQR
ncbi:glycosyltransferase family 4 protein [Chloroflexota bacterium]